MNEIEKMLRDGKSVEDIMASVNATKAKIAAEEEAKKKAEAEKAKVSARVSAARAKVINTLLDYMKAMGVEVTKEEEKDFVKAIENELLHFERTSAILTKISASPEDYTKFFKIFF